MQDQNYKVTIMRGWFSLFYLSSSKLGMQDAVEKLMAFDAVNGDLDAFFGDILLCSVVQH